MSYPRKFDRKLFEYVNYLNENNYTVQDKPWDAYSQTSSDWKFPSELEVYYSRMWYNQKKLIENKKVFDLGCEIGSKISWFESLGPQSYHGTDIDETRTKLAKSISHIVFGNDCVTHMTPEQVHTHTSTTHYDTVYCMSVNQYMSKPWTTIMNLKCNNLVIDTWTNQGVSLTSTLEILTEKYRLTKLIKLWDHRVGLILST